MDGNTKTSCTHDRSSVGNCNLVQYDEELPEIYQNFDKVEGVTRKNIGKVCLFFKAYLLHSIALISFHLLESL